MLPKGCEKLLVRFNPATEDPLPNLNSKQDLMGEWRKYFAKLLNTPPVSSTAGIPTMEIDLPIKLVTTLVQKVKCQSKASWTRKLLELTLLCELKPSSMVAKDCSTS